MSVGDTDKKNTVVIPASETRNHGGLNREATVTSVVSSVVFKFSVSGEPSLQPYTGTSGGTVLAEKAPTQVLGVPGPYTYDPAAGIPVTSTDVKTAQVLNENQTYGFVQLDTGTFAQPALQFPDEPGYLVFQFGASDVVGPVKYFGRLGTDSLIIDASFRFPHDVVLGADVTLLSGRTPFQPQEGQTAGSFYATGSAAGRVAAQKALGETFAAGMPIDVEVIYPGDRGLGAEGFPDRRAQKLSDAVTVWAGDDPDSEIPKARNS